MRGGKRGHALVAESAKAQAAAERGALALERELRAREAELGVVRAQLDAATAWSASDPRALLAAAEGLAARAPSSLVALGVGAGAAALVAGARNSELLPLSLHDAASKRAARAIESGAKGALRASAAIEAQLAELDAALAGMDFDQDGRVGLHEFTGWWLAVGSQLKAAIDRSVEQLLGGQLFDPAELTTTRWRCVVQEPVLGCRPLVQESILGCRPLCLLRWC